MVERGRHSVRRLGLGSPRSSQRSHGTSSSSSHDTKFECKDFCRKFVSFMCTQVGVGGLVVSYAIIGAFAFIEIEGFTNHTLANVTEGMRNNTLHEMWVITEQYNVLSKDAWNTSIKKSLLSFQENMVEKITKEGYDGRDRKLVWGDFSSTLIYCLSVFTMIGYGHMTPITDWGKIATIVYAMFGIPIYIVYFMNMGKVFAKSFKFLYRSWYRCINRSENEDLEQQRNWDETLIIVPSTACIWVMIFYMVVGTITFALWEGWEYLDSWYFSFTSLSKIGIGDFVPGKVPYGKENEAILIHDTSHFKLLLNFMYLLIGMGLIAMCYTLMKEEIQLKLRATKQEVREKCYYCGLRLGLYTEDEPEFVPPPRYRSSRTSSKRSVRHR